MLNRGVVIVRPKQPYLDWAAGLDDSGILPDPNERPPPEQKRTRCGAPLTRLVAVQ